MVCRQCAEVLLRFRNTWDFSQNLTNFFCHFSSFYSIAQVDKRKIRPMICIFLQKQYLRNEPFGTFFASRCTIHKHGRSVKFEEFLVHGEVKSCRLLRFVCAMCSQTFMQTSIRQQFPDLKLHWSFVSNESSDLLFFNLLV